MIGFASLLFGLIQVKLYCRRTISVFFYLSSWNWMIGFVSLFFFNSGLVVFLGRIISVFFISVPGTG